MSQAQDDLVARATDPNAELTTLHELAQNYPGLRPYIAANPRTYPDLLNWLGTLGDPAVDAALAARTQAQMNGAFTTAVQDPVTATQALPDGDRHLLGRRQRALDPGPVVAAGSVEGALQRKPSTLV